MKLLRKICLFCCTALLLVSASLACAAEKTWDGTYMWSQSAQYSNGFLSLKTLKDGSVLYDFNLMRGSEKEDSSVEYNYAGIMQNADKRCTVELTVNKKPIKLDFQADGKDVLVKQTGRLSIDVSGKYYFYNEDGYQVSEEGAVALLESLSPALTSLNRVNRPYQINLTDEDDTKLVLTAVHTPSGTVIATYQVAKDLSAVYRIDGEKKVVIY